jgi:hypothetical protein
MAPLCHPLSILENPRNPFPFRILTNILKVLEFAQFMFFFPEKMKDK